LSWSEGAVQQTPFCGLRAQAVYSQGYGAVLDSGTTFTYLPAPAHAQFLAAVKAHALGRGLQLVEGPDKNVRHCRRPTRQRDAASAAALKHMCWRTSFGGRMDGALFPGCRLAASWGWKGH
jgi:hypothetical protein